MGSFTVICNKCGAKNVGIGGGYDGDYHMYCNEKDCDNFGSYDEGDLKINDEDAI